MTEPNCWFHSVQKWTEKCVGGNYSMLHVDQQNNIFTLKGASASGTEEDIF